MRTTNLCLAVLAGTLTLALGGTKIGSYNAMFTNKDFTNSSGAKISGTAAVIQQDRANYHKFNKKDELDTGSGFFNSVSRRSQIPAMLKRGGVSNKLIRQPDPESLWKFTIMENSNGKYYLVVELIAG